MAKRRGNGEGSITYRKKERRYMGRYTVHTTDGPKQKAVYGKTRAEAWEKLVKAMAEQDNGLVFDAGKLTTGLYLTSWLNDSVKDSVKPVTFDSYERLVRVHLIPALGRVRLKALTPPHIRRLYREKLDSGLSPRTVQYMHAILQRALKAAVNDGLIPRNPCAAVDPPQVRRKEIRPLDRDQVRTLFEATACDRLEALYIVAVHCGLRQGELLGLKWEDIDLEAGTLSVRRTLSNGKFTPPKTAKSRRSVNLTPTAIEALKRHCERQAQEMMKADTLYRDQGIVFASQVGTPLSRHNLTRSFKALLRRAELPESTRFHDLRHTCATLLLGKGFNGKFVQELLGHATIAITLDTYSHVMPGMADHTAAMEDALNP
jgi:integrase